MKKGGVFFKIIIIIIIIIILIAAGIFIYAWLKLSNLQHESIDISDLAINDNLYDDIKTGVDGGITEDEFNEVVNFVLLGSDSRNVNSMESGRSDTIMIASINPMKKSINLVSIPRDTYVTVPGYGKTKINHAYAYGKEQLTLKTINSNFNLNITDYVTIDFSGLKNIIDEIGGIELELSTQEKEYIGIKDSRLNQTGKIKLNGEEALKHSRNRTVGNDFTRAERQRDVMEAIINKIASLEINQILALSDEFLKEVKTNINVTSYIGLLTSIISNKNEYLSNITSNQVPSSEYAKGQMIDGIYYFVSDMEKAKNDLYNILYGD